VSVGSALTAQPPALDAAARTAVVVAIAKVLDERYVSRDVGRKYGAHLQTRLTAGAFEAAAALHRRR
jgi:hypothetical protein